MRKEFLIGSFLILFLVSFATFYDTRAAWIFIVLGPLLLLGFSDFFQTKKAILRNFPIIGHFRYLLEMIRPEIQQYFIESNSDGTPFSRETRSVIYQRAKKTTQTVPFGTQKNVYEVGYSWVNHSLAPKHINHADLRVTIGGSDCEKPYSASLFNISAMSFGALSDRAISALNKGAKIGAFAHNTGEGSISSHHLHGGDLVWQIGTGYFGCRHSGGEKNGQFNEELFSKNAQRPEVKMIEIKLSQGAKPGHGGILPAAKITPEIAEIRNVPQDQDVLSPPAHSAFSTPIELLQFVQKLRELSGGKPIGFKLCVGKRREFFSICKAMIKTGITPDFIAVDGGEGGTGAAPLEFTNHIGFPLSEGLVFVHNALEGTGLRGNIKIIASGKIATAMDIISKISLGADLCYSARGMMISLGCIQALRCNSNHCPVGIATQSPDLIRGLVVSNKAQRVANYHQETLEATAEILGSMGLDHPRQLRPWHIVQRTNQDKIQHFGEIHDYLKPGDLLDGNIPKSYEWAWNGSTAKNFSHPQDQ